MDLAFGCLIRLKLKLPFLKFGRICSWVIVDMIWHESGATIVSLYFHQACDLDLGVNFLLSILLFATNKRINLKSLCGRGPKVCAFHLVLVLNQTPIFDWHVIWWGSKNKHHEDTRWEYIRLHLWIFLPTLHSTMNTIGRTYVFTQAVNKGVSLATITKSKEVWF